MGRRVAFLSTQFSVNRCYRRQLNGLLLIVRTEAFSRAAAKTFISLYARSVANRDERRC